MIKSSRTGLRCFIGLHDWFNCTPHCGGSAKRCRRWGCKEAPEQKPVLQEEEAE